jgi:hypothetical protein
LATGLKTAIAAVKGKAAATVLATVLAASAVGGGTAAAAANGAFGQQVKAKVESCKDALAKGTHGIGECVSVFAQQHGAQQRQQHSEGKAPTDPRNTHGNSDSHGGSPSRTPGAGDGHGQGGPPSGTPGASNGQGHGKP